VAVTRDEAIAQARKAPPGWCWLTSTDDSSVDAVKDILSGRCR
jgi:hypothetical protein